LTEPEVLLINTSLLYRYMDSIYLNRDICKHYRKKEYGDTRYEALAIGHMFGLRIDLIYIIYQNDKEVKHNSLLVSPQANIGRFLEEEIHAHYVITKWRTS